MAIEDAPNYRYSGEKYESDSCDRCNHCDMDMYPCGNMKARCEKYDFITDMIRWDGKIENVCDSYDP